MLLRYLFGFKKTEKRCHLDHCEASCEGTKTPEASLKDKTVDQLGCILSQALESLKKVKNCLQKKKKKGHGRLGHEAYTGAKVVKQEHESLKAGDPYPGVRGTSLCP